MTNSVQFQCEPDHRIVQAIRSATTPFEPGRAALVPASYPSRRSTELPCMRSQDRLGTLTRRRGRKETRPFATGICTYVHTHTHTYIYTYIYIYMDTHIYTHIYIYSYMCLDHVCIHGSPHAFSRIVSSP